MKAHPARDVVHPYGWLRSPGRVPDATDSLVQPVSDACACLSILGLAGGNASAVEKRPSIRGRNKLTFVLLLPSQPHWVREVLLSGEKSPNAARAASWSVAGAPGHGPAWTPSFSHQATKPWQCPHPWALHTRRGSGSNRGSVATPLPCTEQEGTPASQLVRVGSQSLLGTRAEVGSTVPEPGPHLQVPALPGAAC